MTKLLIAENFRLPADAVTQTFAILAKRGAGKTYLASVLAEEMLRSSLQVLVVDPTGAWWGLRSSADGKGPGFPIVILGGPQADVPLEEHAGELIAQAIVENRFSAVLDLSLFRKGQLIRFMVVFAEALYRLNREALHLFVDEADAVAPQGRSGFGEENRMLGAMEDIVRRGRIRGIGCTLITQRPAVLNKNVLTQVESLFVLRMNHPKDIGAIEEWVNVHADPQEARDVIESLPSLPIGTAWFWSPGRMNELKRIAVRKRETFDSSATPKPGHVPRRPRHLAEIDLANLGEKIKATAETAKANDPRELRRRLAELEKQLRDKPAALPSQIERVEVPVLRDGQLEKALSLVHRMEKFMGSLRDTVGSLATAIGQSAKPAPAPAPARPTAIARPIALRRPQVESPRTQNNSPIGGGPRKILTALAQYPQGKTKVQVAVLAGYAHNGGAFNNYLGSLRSQGFIEGSSSLLRITEAGTAALGDFEPLPTGPALADYWLRQLGRAERLILEKLIGVYPNVQSKEDLGAATGYEPNGGGFNNALSRLRTLELIEGRGEIRASDALFQE